MTWMLYVTCYPMIGRSRQHTPIWPNLPSGQLKPDILAIGLTQLKVMRVMPSSKRMEFGNVYTPI